MRAVHFFRYAQENQKIPLIFGAGGREFCQKSQRFRCPFPAKNYQNRLLGDRADLTLFPVERNLWYSPNRPAGNGEKLTYRVQPPQDGRFSRCCADQEKTCFGPRVHRIHCTRTLLYDLSRRNYLPLSGPLMIWLLKKLMALS